MCKKLKLFFGALLVVLNLGLSFSFPAPTNAQEPFDFLSEDDYREATYRYEIRALNQGDVENIRRDSGIDYEVGQNVAVIRIIHPGITAEIFYYYIAGRVDPPEYYFEGGIAGNMLVDGEDHFDDPKFTFNGKLSDGASSLFRPSVSGSQNAIDYFKDTSNTNPGEEEEEGNQQEEANEEEAAEGTEAIENCYSQNSTLSAGWIACGFFELIDNIVTNLFEAVDNMLDVNAQEIRDNEALKATWSYFRAIATFLLLAVGLAMVIGQAIGG